MRLRTAFSSAVLLLLLTAACSRGSSSNGGGTGTGTGTVVTSTVGGLLTGLAQGDTVVLQNNGGDDLVLSAPGPFTFPTELEAGTSYAVTVLQQPASGSCAVAGGTGTMGALPVESVTVDFTPPDASYFAADSSGPVRMRELSRLSGGGPEVSGAGLGYARIGGLAAGPNGELWAVTNELGQQGQPQLLQIDRATGEVTLLGTISGAKQLTGLCYHDASSELYAFNNQAKEVVRFAPGQDPQAIWVAAVNANNVQAMALDTTNDLLCLFDVQDDLLLRLPRTGGGLQDQLALPADLQFTGAAWEPAGQRLLAFSDADRQLYSVTTAPLTVTAIGASGARSVDGLAWSGDADELLGATFGTPSVLLVLDTAVNSEGLLAETVACTGVDTLFGLARGDGTHWACTDGWLGRLDPTSGALRMVGELAPATGIRSLFWDAGAQQLYGVEVVAGGADVVHLIDTQTAATSPVLTLSDASLDVHGASYDASGNRALLVAAGAADDQLLSVDLSGGNPAGPETLIGATGVSGLRGLLWDDSIRLLYAVSANSNELLRVDPWTGAATVLGNADNGCEALTAP